MKYLFISFIFLLFTIKLYSQDEYKELLNDLSDDITEYENRNSKEKKFKFDGKMIGFTLSLLGDHIFEFRMPVIKDYMDFDGYIKSPKVRNDIGLEIYFKKLKLISHWKFDLILNQWVDWRKLIEIIPQENYVSWSPWKFTFSIGFKNYYWGTADQINPTDNINLKDLRKPVDSSKISVFSVYTSFFPADFISLEAIYIPFIMNINLTMNPEDIVEEEYEEADVSIKDIQFKPEHFGLGGKVSFFFRYVDFSFSYLTKIDPYYSMEIELEKQKYYNVHYYTVESIELINKRLHFIGTDLKWSIGIFGLWLEVCYKITEDFFMDKYNIRNHQLSWATGFDFNFGPDSAFYCNIQYFGSFVPFFYSNFYKDYDDGEPDINEDQEYYDIYYYRILTDNLGGVREGLINGIAVHLKWPMLNSLLTPSLKVIYTLPSLYDTDREIRFGSLYLKTQLDIMPFETFNILIGAELFFSWHILENEFDNYEEDLIGSNHKNSNVFLEVRYRWGIDVKR